jgi:Holliday junction resolvase RusA-like endonuclease
VWEKECDWTLLATVPGKRPTVQSPYAIHIVLDLKSRMDLDNCVKPILDYLVRAGIVMDDGPKHMQRLVVERGDVGKKQVRVFIEEV